MISDSCISDIKISDKLENFEQNNLSEIPACPKFRLTEIYIYILMSLENRLTINYPRKFTYETYEYNTQKYLNRCQFSTIF